MTVVGSKRKGVEDLKGVLSSIDLNTNKYLKLNGGQYVIEDGEEVLPMVDYANVVEQVKEVICETSNNSIIVQSLLDVIPNSDTIPISKYLNNDYLQEVVDIFLSIEDVVLKSNSKNKTLVLCYK